MVGGTQHPHAPSLFDTSFIYLAFLKLLCYHGPSLSNNITYSRCDHTIRGAIKWESPNYESKSGNRKSSEFRVRKPSL